MLGVSRQRVHQLIEAKKIVAVPMFKRGRRIDWLIQTASVVARIEKMGGTKWNVK